jgi:hypothetical protein
MYLAGSEDPRSKVGGPAQTAHFQKCPINRSSRRSQQHIVFVNFPLNSTDLIDPARGRNYPAVVMSEANLDQLRLAYKKAVDEWVDTIRAEEALATPDHSMIAMEDWDTAHFREHDAHNKVTEARDAYKDALRTVNYGI